MKHRTRYPDWTPPPGTGTTTITVGKPWAAVSIPANVRLHATVFSPVEHVITEDEATWLLTAPPNYQEHEDWRRIERYVTHHAPGTALVIPQADRRAEHGTPYWEPPGRRWSGARFIDNWLAAALYLAVTTRPLGMPAMPCPLCREPMWEDQRTTVLLGPYQRGPRAHADVHRTCADAHGLKSPGPRYDWGVPL